MTTADAAREARKAVGAFHGIRAEHRIDTDPETNAWPREVLTSLQAALNRIAAAQIEIAEQVDRNARDVHQIQQFLNRHGKPRPEGAAE